MNLKRIKIFFGIFSILSLLLAGRLWYIQLIGHKELSAAAAMQQQVAIVGLDQRGTIYDRKMKPLTGSTTEYIYLTYKDRVDEAFYEIMRGLGAGRRGSENSDYIIYASEQYGKEIAEKLAADYGTYIIEGAKRYEDSQSAAHVIGYVNTYDNRGISGIEYELNDILSTARGKVYGIADRNGSLLPGFSLRYEKEGTSGSDIVLTIDSDLQAIAEEVLSESDYDGAVVILDTKSGEILAIASTPMYNPNSVKDYIDSNGSELFNKCTQGEYPPVSIFKIVVTAAALENEICDENGRKIDENTVFYCAGKEVLAGIEIGCSTGGTEGHGKITLKDAFAYSCNCAFIQLGQLTGSENIIAMAEKMGFGEISLRDIPSVRQGNVTSAEDAAGDGIGNLSIGQGEMLATPLQIARMTNIIALQGNDIELSLLKNAEEITNRQSKKFTQRTVRTGILSQETAEMITALMSAVTDYGTARGIDREIEAAGKTGSAENRIYGEELVHGWFTGFFPVSDPQYTITVFAENGRSGRTAAVPIFEKIVEKMQEQGLYRMQ